MWWTSQNKYIFHAMLCSIVVDGNFTHMHQCYFTDCPSAGIIVNMGLANEIRATM